MAQDSKEIVDALGGTKGVTKTGKFAKFLGQTPMGYLGETGLFVGMNLLEGESLGTSLVRGIGEQALWRAAPGVMLGYMAATGLPELGKAAYERARTQGRWWNQMHRPNFGGVYRDTQQAVTMRQAAVQAIAGSRMNARSALGGEARLMHIPYEYSR